MGDIKNIFQLDPQKYGRPPEPTAETPFAQVEWIFDKRRDRVASESGQKNYQGAKTFFIEHIKCTAGHAPYFLVNQWDEFALLRFKEQLEDRIDSGDVVLKSHSLVGIFSAVRQVMREAATYGLLRTRAFQDVSFGSAFKETDAHVAYSDRELEQIFNAVAQELQLTRSVASGYKRQAQGTGIDPRVTPKKGRDKGFGYAVEANMRWYFEHVLDCNPIVGVAEAKRQHSTFLLSATNNHGGLHNLYARWGVAAYIDENLLMPLLVELFYLTGLNPSSLLALKVDCIRDEHPLTGMPCLLFEKERSGGEKELHLPLLDSREQRPLMRKQSLRVRRVVESVVNLTSRIREKLPPDHTDRQLLFLYESTSVRYHGQIRCLTNKQTSAWCTRMIEKHNLRADSGDALIFNLVRFRSTKLTEMALEGRDFFEIQQIARHKSIRQTAKYISLNRLDAPARKTVSDALERIRANQKEAQTSASTEHPKPQAIRLMKGIISDCMNAFDPPEKVKRAVDYVPGQACTRFNMCLFCRNVVVFKEHLPSLAAYRAQILATKANNVQNLPHASLYDQTLAVLDNLLDPNVSQFTSGEIEWAIEMSTTIDEVVDPLLYRGTCR